jgi:hypothetical protein
MADRERENEVTGGAPESPEQVRGVSNDDEEFDDAEDLDDEEDTDQEGTF